MLLMFCFFLPEILHMQSCHEPSRYPYKTLGRAFFRTGQVALVVQSVLGAIAVDIAMFIILVDMAKKRIPVFGLAIY